MKKVILLLTALMIMLGALAQNKKESVQIEKKAKFELASKALQAKTFGFLPDNRIQYSRHNFLGFEKNKLILQGVFSQGSRLSCDVKNYVYKADKDGNIVVTFDFKGRVATGNIRIDMKKGDNFAEIIEVLNYSVWNNVHNPLHFYGEVLPSDSCDYMVETKEL